MFSGLTSQLNIWMGSAQNDQKQKVDTSTDDGTEAASNPQKQHLSPTKHSKLDMSNVKSENEEIGGRISFNTPKFLKDEDEGEQESQERQPLIYEADTLSEVLSEIEPTDVDGSLSTIAGTASEPQSDRDTPSEEGDNTFGNVQSIAKSLGSLLYSAVNKAGKTVTEAGAKLIKTVEENSILREFNKEQDAFLKSQKETSTSALPSWAGCVNEEALKEECLSLSKDKRNFVRTPPAGVDFEFDYDASYLVAMANIDEDPNLKKMRFDLVPKIISEEKFWKNYFYRVSLIYQANELSFMSRKESKMIDFDEPIDKDVKDISDEFVSDTFQATSDDLVEVQEGMKKLAFGFSDCAEEWEKELEAELEDFEMITENKSLGSINGSNVEKQMEEILDGL